MEKKFEAFEIYPTEIGWKLLENKCREYWRLLDNIFIEHYNYYKIDDHTFKLEYSNEICVKYFGEFMVDSEFCTKLPTEIESAMSKYLRLNNMTYDQFEQSARNRVLTEYD